MLCAKLQIDHRYNLDESRMKFQWNLNYNGKIICKTGPKPDHYEHKKVQNLFLFSVCSHNAVKYVLVPGINIFSTIYVLNCIHFVVNKVIDRDIFMVLWLGIFSSDLYFYVFIEIVPHLACVRIFIFLSWYFSYSCTLLLVWVCWIICKENILWSANYWFNPILCYSNLIEVFE